MQLVESHFENAYVGTEERDIRKDLNDRMWIKTSYNFLMSHKGFRPGMLHGLLGLTSGGKTTMIRSLVMDFLHFSAEDDQVLLWLSEESRENYKNNISYSGFSNEEMHKKHKQVQLFSEVDSNKMSPQDKKKVIEDHLTHGNYKLMILDNISTSPLFGGSHKSYEAGVDWLKALAHKTNVAILIVMHTAKNTSQDKLIQPEDARNSGRLPNVCEYFYILQGFTVESQRHTFLRVAKHRNHNIVDSLFDLQYSPKHRIFFKDNAKKFSEFKKLFKARDRL